MTVNPYLSLVLLPLPLPVSLFLHVAPLHMLSSKLNGLVCAYIWCDNRVTKQQIIKLVTHIVEFAVLHCSNALSQMSNLCLSLPIFMAIFSLSLLIWAVLPPYFRNWKKMHGGSFECMDLHACIYI